VKSTHEISTVRVKLSSVVVRGHVNLGLVDEAVDLDVRRGHKHLNTLKSTIGNEASAVTGLCAPGNFLLLGITDSRVGDGGCP